ncbi:MAG TPA: mechanosensitive ion channel family protein [Vicinamibacterales bacterium]|nr:mechanosensitive ion channel family protein [Vicinamibacterales bacterium]
MPLRVLVGFALLVTSLGLHRATINRHIRGRLLLSALLFAAYTLAASSLYWVSMPDDTRDILSALNPLLLAFGIINLVVTLTINPWRVDRLPDRFPNIVQDTLVMALFALVATLVLRDRMLATTAVGAVVLGLALQDTLGNFFAGLAIQIEKPFRVGDWVTIGGEDGVVSEITWRATKMRTKSGNFIVVPNSTLAKDTIVNYCQPTRLLRLEVEVGVTYDAPPNVVKGVIAQALRDASLLSHDRAPEVLLVNFGDSALIYRVRFWISDFEADERAKDQVRSLLYYALKRHGLTIPFHIEVQMSAEEAGLVPPRATLSPQTLAAVPIFEPLSTSEREQILAIAKPVVFAAGESIVREGDAGRSLFVLLGGEASVSLAGTSGEVARLRKGDVFGEMSLLTGEPRTATVTAATDCDLIEIDAEGFRSVVMTNASVLDHVTSVTASRREGLDRHREAYATAATTTEARQTLLKRVRQFLRL